MSQSQTDRGAPVAAGSRNQRATVRYRCAPATIGKLYVANDHEFQHAWIDNLSLTGVGLVLARPLSSGTDIVVHLRASETGKVYELLARVMHCTRQPQGDWAVGCEFARALDSEDLDRLL